MLGVPVPWGREFIDASTNESRFWLPARRDFHVAFAPVGALAEDYWQCVPFARLMSGIQIFGDAHTWWQQAAGRYQTGFTPKGRGGAVLQADRKYAFRSCGRGEPGPD